MPVETKICTKCKKEKELSMFSLNKGGTKTIAQCKKCYVEYSKKYAHDNRERHRKKQREYDIRNKEMRLEKYSAYLHKSRLSLADSYIKIRLRVQFGINPPQELIELKRKQLELKRLVNEKRKQINGK